MVKTIRKTIQITTRKRNNSVKINEEFYSYDKNNAQFEFIMDYDIPADKVIALFHFEQTNRYYETLCQFKGNMITIEFDTSLIVEDELVTGYLYFDKLEKSTDVYRFTFGARVSEIDKTRELPVQEKVSRRIVPVADIVTKQELDELLAGIKKNGEMYDDSELRGRVTALENKPDNDTRYDDSDVKNRLSVLETNASRYLTEHQPLTSIEERIQQVEARFNNLSNIYLSSHQSLEHLATKQELNAVEQRVQKLEAIDVTSFATNTKVEAVEQRVQTLENKPDVDLSHVVTKQELENKHYIQDISNLATNEKVTTVENRVQALETDTSEFARKSEIPQPYNDSALTERVNLLEAKAIANGAYDDKPLLDKIHAIEEKSNAAITAHQSLEHLVTRDELEEKHYLTSVPEEYAKKSDLSDLATNTKVEAVENRVQVLENKSVVTHEELEQAGYAKTTDLSDLATNSTVFRISDKVNNLERKAAQDAMFYVSKEELESKGYIHDVSGLATKQELEAAKASIPQPYNDTEIRGQLARKVDTDTLATLATKQELQTNDEEVKRRLTTLEGKTDNFITGVSVNKEGSNVTLTYNYVDGQSKNVSFTDSDTINVAYDDSDLRNRVVALETKEDKDTKYDDTEVKRRLTELESKPTVDTSVFVTEEKLNSKGYITDISRLATKEELAKAVTKEELEGKNYVTTDELNNKGYSSSYHVASLKDRLFRLEMAFLSDSKNYLTTTVAEETYAKKSELPAPYNDSALASRVSALESKQDKDTVYNDTELKQRLTALENRPTGGGSQTRDTGWITIKDGTDTFGQIVKIRRIDNMVHIQIASNSPDGLSIDFGNVDMVQHLMPQLGFNTSTDVIVPITYSHAYLSGNPTYTNINGLAVIRVRDSELRIKVYSEVFTSVGEHCHINIVSYFTDDPFPNDLTGLD